MKHADLTKQVNEIKAEVMTVLHSLTDCHQMVLGYFELAEYRKSYIMCLECRSKYATLAARISQLDAIIKPL